MAVLAQQAAAASQVGDRRAELTHESRQNQQRGKEQADWAARLR